MSIAILHTLPGHFETLSVILAYQNEHPEYKWTLYCEVEDAEFQQWLKWWPKFPHLTILPHTHFLQEAGYERNFDAVIADTDDDALVACMDDKSKLFIVDHTSLDRSGAKFRVATRPFAQSTADATCTPCFDFPSVRSAPRRNRRKVVMVGLGHGDNDWDAIRDVVSTSQFELTIVSRSLKSLHAEDPNRQLRINQVEGAPTPFMMRVLSESSVMLVPKTGTYVNDSFCGCIGLALQYNLPIVMPADVAANMFPADVDTTGVVFTYGDRQSDDHERSDDRQSDDHERSGARSAVEAAAGSTSDRPRALGTLLYKRFSGLLDTFIASNKLVPMVRKKRISILQSLPFHYEILGSVFEYIQQLENVHVTLWFAKFKYFFEWPWWHEYYLGVFGGSIPVDEVRIADTVDDFQLDHDDAYVLPTDDDIDVLKIIPDMGKLIVLDHSPLNRSGAKTRLAMRRFDPFDNDVLGVLMPCYKTPFTDFRRPLALQSRRGNVNVCVAGVGNHILWTTIQELADADMANITIISRFLSTGSVMEKMQETLVWKMIVLVDPPVWKMIEEILQSDVVLIPKADAYLQHIFAGSIALALTLGRAVVMPHPMAVSCFGPDYYKDTHGSIVGFKLPPDASLEDTEEMTEGVGPPERQAEFEAAVRDGGLPIAQAVGHACKTPEKDVLEFRDKVRAENIKLWDAAFQNVSF